VLALLHSLLSPRRKVKDTRQGKVKVGWQSQIKEIPVLILAMQALIDLKRMALRIVHRRNVVGIEKGIEMKEIRRISLKKALPLPLMVIIS